MSVGRHLVGPRARRTIVEKTPVTTKVQKDQVKNSAGGYVFQVDDWTRLDRFLILGSEGGTYYISERKLTQDNAKCVVRCLAADFKRTVDRIVEVSDRGLAPKNDPALLALAIACSVTSQERPQNDSLQRYAFDALPKVARIPTHLFHFCDYIQHMRGWGRGLRNAISRWYNSKPTDKLALHLVKYQGRDGWTHRDVLRLAHPTPPNEYYSFLYAWATADPGKSHETAEGVKETEQGIARIQAFEKLKRCTTAEQVVKLVLLHGMPRECVPTKFLADPHVWEALYNGGMPMMAMIRNLGNMSKCGLLKPLSDFSKLIVARLGNTDELRRARVHPMQLLFALKTYGAGHGFRGKGQWNTVPQVVDALDDAFYASFENVEPTGKRWFLGLDVSGSMSSPLAGTMITCAEGTAAMAMLLARREENYLIRGFDTKLIDLKVTAKDSLATALRKVSDRNWGGTNCSVPPTWARAEKIDVDVFCIMTDSETWAGGHPSTALRKYRAARSIPAKMIVVGMEANEFTIADPNDGGMLDVVGFDASAPAVMANFVRDKEAR